ncbi:MAG: hypothetical protein WA364_11945, partial [Candidatus Nitrosopolaris sp.]
MTIKAEIRDKIIQMAQQEKMGRNQIVYELSKQNIKASAGSVSSILRKCKEGKDKNNLDIITTIPVNETGQDKDDVVPPEATISTTIDNNIIGPPSSNFGDGLVYSSTDDQGFDNGIRKAATGLVPPIKECPLPEDTNPLEKDVKNRSLNKGDIDFAEKSYPDFYLAGNRLAEELRIIKVERDTLEALQREIEESRLVLDADKKAFEEETEVIRNRMRQKVSSEKYLLKHESLVVEQKRKGLDERMMRVEQKERNILIREADLLEAEPFLSLARRFQNMDLEFDAILPLIETVTEIAQMQGMDAKTAAMYVAYELSAFRKLGGLQQELEVAQTQLETAQNQLQMLKTATAQRERGLNMI